MNILFRLFRIFMLASMAAFAAGCSVEDLEEGQTGSGNVQFRLLKLASKATGELDYLHDAHKVMVTLSNGGQNVNLPLKVDYYDEESAEFGVRTEIGQLYPGHYSVVSYTIYNHLDDELLYGEPDETTEFDVITGGLSTVDLYISVVPRGKIRFDIVKDLSEIVVDTKSGPVSDEDRIDYPLSSVAKADIVVKDMRTNVEHEFTGLPCTFRSDALEGSSDILCDTLLHIEAGEYYLSRVALYGASDDTAPLDYLTYYDNDKDVIYTVEDNKTTEAEVPVVINGTAAHIKDYIALYKIWKSLDGENWSWRAGTGTNPDNCNWNFDKDIDLWGNQPGVGLFSNGRVSSLNIGPFDPHGDMSEALGDLTELNTLYLGSNNDVQYEGMVPEYPVGDFIPKWDEDEESARMRRQFDPWNYWVESNVSEARLDYARKLLKARHPENRTEFSVFTGYSSAEKPATFATFPHGYLANHIQSLPESIGNLTKLEQLYIGNSEIRELPEGFAKLQSLTDLQIYNCPAMEKFPVIVAELPNLIMLDLSANSQWEPEDVTAGWEAIFGGKSKEKLQIVYGLSNRMRRFPEKNLDQVAALGLIDFSNNGIEVMNKGFTDKVRLIEVYLDYNYLTSIPDDFTGVRDLATFSCTNNRLTEFPGFFPDPATEDFMPDEILLSANKIESFPDDFKGLNVSSLDLSNNCFKKFPLDLARTGSILGMLNLSYNQIDDFPKEAFEGLKQVQALDISMNWISEIDPEFSLAEDAPYLQQVDMSKNRFTSFPTRLFSGYSLYTFWFGEQMDAEGNKCFKSWPTGIETYTWLKNLKVNGNDIREVPDFPSELYSLDVSGNPNIIMEIPADVCAEITGGTYIFTYDTDQTGITGCDALGITED